MTTTREREAPLITVPAAGAGLLLLERPRTGTAGHPTADIVDQWGMHSFPASDPPANW
jgi:hypothetical protein